MPTNTAKYVIPQLNVGDTLASSPTTLTNLANRIDLLLGESGQFTASPAAATSLAIPITLSRTYPGNNAAVAPAIPGTLMLWVPSVTVSSATSWNWWVTNWLGSATTITGFTFNMQWSAAQTNRVFHWRYLPSL